MLAVRRADVADLNLRAQAELVATGHLDPDGPSADLGAGQTALVGDHVLCERNDRMAGLLNGTRLTVTHEDRKAALGQDKSWLTPIQRVIIVSGPIGDISRILYACGLSLAAAIDDVTIWAPAALCAGQPAPDRTLRPKDKS